MKYIDADRLRAEIKRWIRLEELNFAALGGGGQEICINTLEWVLKQIDSLQQEQPEVDLEKELDRYLRGEFQQTAGGNFNNYIQVARHFYELGKLNAKKEN